MAVPRNGRGARGDLLPVRELPEFDPAPAEPAAPAPAAPATPAPPADYIIVKGDTYWDLAEKFLGDPHKWPELQAANPGYKAEDLPIGSPLKVPAKS